MRVTRKSAAVAVVASLALLVTGCGGSSNDEGSGGGVKNENQSASNVDNNTQPRENIKDGGTLTTAVPDFGKQWNGWQIDGNSLYVSAIMDWLQPQMLVFDADGTPHANPDYLLSYKLVNKNPETVKYTINPKANWNDGTPIDWTAYKTTWMTQSGQKPDDYPASSTVGYENIKSVTKGKDAKEAIVTFKTPFYPIDNLFVQVENPKNMDPTFYNKGWIDNLHPELTAGAYTLDNYDKSAKVITLKRNPKWWGDPGKLDKRVFKQMEDEASINAFVNGEIDATGVSTKDRLKRAQDMGNGVEVRNGVNIQVGVYEITDRSPLFQEQAARNAFEMGTDRKQLTAIRYQGMNWKEQPPGSSLMYPFMDGYQDNIADLHYNPKKAKQMLDAAGWKVGKDGIRTKNGRRASFDFVMFGDDPTQSAMARAQQKMAKDIGLDMKIDTRKSSDFSDTLTKKSFDVVSMGWSAESPSDYISGCQLMCSDSQSNYSGLGNKSIDKKLKTVTTISNRDQQIAEVNKAESEALHLGGLLPLSNGPDMLAAKKGLANYGPAGWLTVPVQNIGWVK